MNEISVLIGGKAGEGIRNAALLTARCLSRYGYEIFTYDDYPSLIRGGHNFSIVRASKKRIGASRRNVDIMVAFNMDTVKKHVWRLRDGMLIYDSDCKELKDYAENSEHRSIGIPFESIVKRVSGIPVMKNTAAIAAFAKIVGIEWGVVEEVIKKFLKRKTEKNVEIAKIAYGSAETAMNIEKLSENPLPVASGNEAIALGAVCAGLDAYYAYPMTPSTSILHYLAANSEEFNIAVVHPENEIAVMLMALGSAYAGAKTMVATSGGGFALMVEGLSLAGQSETPITIVLCQRAGPSTGVPTYTMQSCLDFVIGAGHGDFPRFVVAPGDVDEAFYYTWLAMKIAWKFQIPSIVLSDKNLSEGMYTLHEEKCIIDDIKPKLWDGRGEYRRYKITENGVSPLAFPGGDAIVKATSYEHDEYGITAEEADKVKAMQEKRWRKRAALVEELKRFTGYKEAGSGETAIVTWGSTKGACREVAENLGLKYIQPIILEPLPDMKKAFEGVENSICVELNTSGQLAKLLRCNGYRVDNTVLKYDGRPFEVEELEERIAAIVR